MPALICELVGAITLRSSLEAPAERLFLPIAAANSDVSSLLAQSRCQIEPECRARTPA